MEKFEDGQACHVFMNTMKEWNGCRLALPSWDSLTEEQRQVYRDYVNRLPFRQHDPSLSEKFTPT